MCLSIAVTASSADRAVLEAAALEASRIGLPVRVARALRWPFGSGTRARATISESGGCACSLLSDAADWNADTWSMRAEVLEPLATTLEILASRHSGDLTVEALWHGETAAVTVAVTLSELLVLAKANRIGTRTRYVVAGPG